MRTALAVFSVVVATLFGTMAGAVRAQEDRGELPEGIRQLIRAAEQAEQQVKREGGTAVNEEADQKARAAHRAARRAISDYYAAHFDYDRAFADTETLRKEAGEADTKLIAVGSETPPNPTRLQRAQEDRDTKLRALAESEIKLASARQALAAAGNPSGTSTTNASARPGGPPPLPTPDYGGRRTGMEPIAGATTPLYGCRFVYWNAEGSFHLLNQTGTAYYTRFGQSHIVGLDFAFETRNFFFYRPTGGDPAVIEWAFAKYPEIPGFDGQLRYAVWCHDLAGWHWEWGYREAVCDWIAPGAAPAPATPSPQILLPGPASSILPITSMPVVYVVESP